MNPSIKINKAMLLAAGLGTRLRPLTYTVPKPLLPIGDKKLIEYPLGLLIKYGVPEVIINLHHMGDMIKDYLGDGSRYGIEIHYSEEREILGTGGGIKNVEAFFEGKPFISINCDSLIDAQLGELVDRHFETHADATMLLKKLGRNDSYEPINIDKNGWITKIGGTGGYFYTGVQIIGPKLIALLPKAGTPSCLIKDGYLKLLSNGGKINSLIYDGYFNDVGTHERYEAAKPKK